LSSVFSYDTPKLITSTTEIPLVTQATLIHRSNMKKFLPATVTSKTIEIKAGISDKFDHEELMMEPVKLMPKDISNRRVIFINHTMPFKPHPTASSGKFLSSTQADDDDDGVTIVNEDESLDSEDDTESSEEDYEFEYEDETPEPSTIKAPMKISKKIPLKPQRRVIQAASKKAKPQNHLNFASFLRFLKNIQESFATRTAKNINDKINMLRKFRDKLLIAINSRIKSLWRNKSSTKKKQHKRTKRTLGGGGGGEGWMSHAGSSMESYPSAEGALLSISFLTFAVFLIKLVLVSEHTDFISNFVESD
jgi:hypothetical protein